MAVRLGATPSRERIDEVIRVGTGAGLAHGHENEATITACL